MFGSKPPTLFKLSWGPFPQRVTIYLQEKKLPPSNIKHVEVDLGPSGLTATNKPPGSVPILTVHGNNTGDCSDEQETFHIMQSIAIIEYLEDIYEEDTAAGKYPSLRGRTPKERAKVRQIVNLADVAINQLGNSTTFGSQLKLQSSGMTGNPDAAKYAWQDCHKKLDQIEQLADTVRDGNAMLVHMMDGRDEVSIADIVVFATLAFMKRVYGTDLLADGRHPRLEAFWDAFERRDSARPPACEVPSMVLEMAPLWYSGGQFVDMVKSTEVSIGA